MGPISHDPGAYLLYLPSTLFRHDMMVKWNVIMGSLEGADSSQVAHENLAG